MMQQMPHEELGVRAAGRAPRGSPAGTVRGLGGQGAGLQPSSAAASWGTRTPRAGRASAPGRGSSCRADGEKSGGSLQRRSVGTPGA